MAVKNGYSGALKRPRLVYGEDRKDPVDMAAGMVRGDLAAPAAGHGSQWSSPLDDAANKYLNREKFQYDVNEDALYHQYKDLYTMQGQQAMVDTMGQAATLTGGYGNSYAQTAGQQAYQGHIQKLGEVVPELYQLALDKYKMEGDQARDRASFLAQMDDRDYSRWESERNFQYQKDQDAEDKRRYDQEWEEDKWRYDTEWQKKYGKKPDRGDGTGDTPQYAGPVPAPKPKDPQHEEQQEDQKDPETDKKSLSEAGENFMKNLPYASAGTSEETWKQIVRERLDRSGLSYEDKVEIGYRLGL